MTRAAAVAASARWRHARLALELAVLAVIVLDFGRIVIDLIALGAPLHWDEAVYAVRARSWVDAELPLSGWSYIRPPLLPLLAAAPVLAGGEEWQLRSLGLVAGVGMLLGAWWLGRMMAGPVAGLLAAGVLHGSPTLQKESATLLTDVPAAALLLLLAGLLWQQLEERPQPGVALVAAAAVAAFAFFMRYGSVLAVAPLLGVAVLLWWSRLRANLPFAVAAVVVGVVALGGHVAWSQVQTGAPLGILIDAQNVVADGALPLREYEGYVPFTLAGSVGAAALRLGVLALPAAALIAAVRPGWTRALRAALFLVVPAAAHVFLVTRGVGHAEERFFLFSTAMLVIAGASAAALIVRATPLLGRPVLLAAAAVALVLARGEAVDHSLQRTVETARYYSQFEVAAKAIRSVAHADCGIVGGGDPILAWYSRCETDRLRLPEDGGPPGANLVAAERWAVLFGHRDEIDWSARIPSAVLAAAEDEPLVITDPDSGEEIASAWRLSSRSADGS